MPRIPKRFSEAAAAATDAAAQKAAQAAQALAALKDKAARMRGASEAAEASSSSSASNASNTSSACAANSSTDGAARRNAAAAVTGILNRIADALKRWRTARNAGEPQTSDAPISPAGSDAPDASGSSDGSAQREGSHFGKYFGLPKLLRRDNPSITLRVSLASALVVLLFTIAAGSVTFTVTYYQAQEIQDERLEEVAGMLARTKAAFSRQPPSFQAFFMDDDAFERRWLLDDDDPRAGLPAGTDIIIQTLHRNGRALPARFRHFLPDGFHTLTLRHHQEYRIRLRTLTNGAHVIVGERTSAVMRAAVTNTLNLIVPLALLSVFLGVAIAWIAWRTMRPVKSLAHEIGERSGRTYSPVSEAGVPSEILPLITAFNGLLQRVEALRGQEARFVADAAHELRSPLTALSLQAEALEKADLSPEAREKMRTLRSGIDRAVRQVSQLLALKRAQAGSVDAAAKADGEPAPEAPVAQAIGEAVESVYWEAEKLGISIEVEGLEDLPEGVDPAFPMKPDDLFTILRNLLENAVRYSPKGGVVTVALSGIAEGSAPVLSVRDKGSGIPAEDRARVLEPFYRRLGTNVSGTGLGLAIVKTLCDRWSLKLELADSDPENHEAPGLCASITPMKR